MLGSTLTLTSLPEDLTKLFDSLERENGFVIDPELRRPYYKHFCGALGAAALHTGNNRFEELLAKKKTEV